MVAWKKAHVSARRSGDGERERLLSQVRNAIRHRIPRRCEACGCAINHTAITCHAHMRHRHSVLYPPHLKLPTP